jgi:competence protein ComEC
VNFFFVGFLIGTFLADFLVYNSEINKILVVMLVLLFCVGLFFWQSRGVRWLILFSFGLVLAIFYFQFFIQKPTEKYISYYNNQTVTLRGEVKDEPEKSGDKTKLVIEIPGIKGRVLVNAPLYPEYKFGDQVEIFGKLQEPPVFDEFNYRNYLKPQGIYSVMYNPKIKKIGDALGFSLKKWLFGIKNYFENTLNKILPEPEAALADGLLLGVRRSVPDWLKNAFIAVGLIHLIALSGYNITVISKNLEILFNYFAPRLAFWLSLLAIWFFVIMVGAKATIVRAALFGSMYLLAHKVGRRRDITRALLLTAFLMVLINPLVLRYDNGFQLSFLATAGLVYLAPIFEEWTKNWRISKSIQEAGIATLSAQFFVLPLLLFNFKQISLVAPIVNILVLPIIPLAMFFIFIAGILGMILLPLGQLVGWITFLFLKYIVLVADYFSKIPGAYLRVGKTSILVALIYWLILGFMSRWLRKKI